MPSSDYERALGLFLLTAGELEVDADFLASVLIDAGDEVGDIVTTRLTFSQTLDLALRLMEMRCSDLIGRAKPVLNKARKLMEERNALVHATREDTLPELDIPVLVRRRGAASGQVVTPNAIDALTLQVSETRYQLLLIVGAAARAVKETRG